MAEASVVIEKESDFPYFQFAAFTAFAIASAWLSAHTFFPDGTRLFAEHWEILPLAFVGAAVANATAIGGGFLFVPLFIFGYGLPSIAALKLSLASQAFGMTSGSLGWSRRFIALDLLPTIGVASIVGLFVGSYIFVLDGLAIKSVFGWVSIFIFIAIILEMQFGHKYGQNDAVFHSRVRMVGLATFSALGGLLTAWTAIGIGEIVALYLLFVYKRPIEVAIGTGVTALAIDSVAGLFIHTQIGGIPTHLLIFTAAGCSIGGFFGARLGRAIEARVRSSMPSDSPRAFSPLKALFCIIILIDGVVMLVHAYSPGT